MKWNKCTYTISTLLKSIKQILNKKEKNIFTIKNLIIIFFYSNVCISNDFSKNFVYTNNSLSMKGVWYLISG